MKHPIGECVNLIYIRSERKHGGYCRVASTEIYVASTTHDIPIGISVSSITKIPIGSQWKV